MFSTVRIYLDGLIVVEDDAAWILSTLAALYWRVRGNASLAIDCLRHSLTVAPVHMKVYKTYP